jgi:hypothetical protein
MKTVTQAGPGFGQLLDWRWNAREEMHTAWHGGRAHKIVKVDRRTAAAQGRGMSSGWHLWDDKSGNDPNRWHGFGPGVGQRVAAAKQMAEAWIICPYADMMGWPKLHLALSGSGVLWNTWVIQLQEDRQRLDVEDRDGSVIALLVPLFIGTGGTTSIRSQALSPGGDLLVEADRWVDLTVQVDTIIGGTQ